MSEFGHHGVSTPGCHIDGWGAGPFIVTIGRRLYRFTDSDRFGPILEARNGNVLPPPGERSRFWSAHAEWLKAGRPIGEPFGVDGLVVQWDRH